jgi:tryptophan synthase alpha chain
MNLERHLRERRDRGHKLLVPYVTGGLGAGWLDVVRAAVDGGADAIEIGIPFSDPVMDGRTIQEASQRALELGATPAKIITEAAQLEVDVPRAVMTYCNPVQHAGYERFATELAGAGIDGAIVPDLPLDELGPWADASSARGPRPPTPPGSRPCCWRRRRRARNGWARSASGPVGSCMQ